MGSEKAYWASVGLLLQNIGGFFGMMTMAKIAQMKGRKIAVRSGDSSARSDRRCSCSPALRAINDIYWMIPLMGFGQLSVFAVYAIYLPELFPTSLRSTGTSFCYNFGRLVAATAPFTIGRITAKPRRRHREFPHRGIVGRARLAHRA